MKRRMGDCRGLGDGGTWRWEDLEMGRLGDLEMGRLGDGETWRLGDWGTWRWVLEYINNLWER